MCSARGVTGGTDEWWPLMRSTAEAAGVAIPVPRRRKHHSMPARLRLVLEWVTVIAVGVALGHFLFVRLDAWLP